VVGLGGVSGLMTDLADPGLRMRPNRVGTECTLVIQAVAGTSHRSNSQIPMGE
jgi:hypothetical protein